MVKTRFIGVGWAFPPSLQQDGGACDMVCDEENIAQSLLVLLSTTPGERVNNYDYGCNIRRFAFDIIDTTTETILRDEIERSIMLFESRVSVDGIIFSKEEAVLNIDIHYTIRQTNRRSNMVYPFYLNEGTDLTL